MFVFKSHKWLLSFTLLVSLISFSGFTHEQVKPSSAITEVLHVNYDSSSAYYVHFYKSFAFFNLSSYYSFNFKHFLQIQNENFNQNEKTQKNIVIESESRINHFHLKLSSVLNIDDYLYTSIV